MQGTLINTIIWAKPTYFFAVPRVWEKFEETLVGAKTPPVEIKKSLGLQECKIFSFGAAPAKHTTVEYF